jgi:hypothetical protein
MFVGDESPMNINMLSNEAQTNKVIGVRNLLLAYSQMIDMELRPVSTGFSVTPMSLKIKRMLRAAYSNDTEGFLNAYREALLESTKEDPHKDVIQKFKQKTVKTMVTKSSMTDEDLEAVMSVMTEEERQRINDANNAHTYYLELLGGTPTKSREKDPQYDNSLRLLSL